MSRRIVKQIGLIIVCLMLIIMMWEGQKTDAAVAATAIPEQSIRLRILANSDAPGDQLVKREIRDAVVAQMGEWVAELENPQSLDEARKVIREHLSEIENRVGEELASRGLNYEYQVELGSVPFPTKLYGGTVYPAGDYEAVRITLGEGKGQNWWCVLFPPLCFIDAGTGDALAKPSTVSAVAAEPGDAEASVQGDTPEARFFLWDMAVKLWSWVTGLFA
ncbi:stage II sporulation protein R [Paenibacillus xylanexedens]|uniref:stage II sporulation protein R n=1 Tax=Paenibacillus xylanexedens TaxID=528191 RepID=UPI0020A104A0|nr:stage II sporulation protein R [Paenibacillus xylanexedens]MCP1423398.1 stage II sporulation protein R [Paenibacillus xylanexedens]